MAHGVFEPSDADDDTSTPFALPVELTRKIAAISEASVKAKTKSKLDWALGYARQGAHVFPAKDWLGEPLVKNWHGAATTTRAKIIEWWGGEFKKADIAAVPDQSGHCVLLAIGEAGEDNYCQLEGQHDLKPAFTFTSGRGNQLYWFTPAGFPSVKLGDGLHLIGDGRFVFLWPSLAYASEEIPDECRAKNWSA